MITVTRFNGGVFALNADLIERVEATPDTVITLVDGTKYVVSESLEEIVTAVHGSKAAVIAMSHLMDLTPNPNSSLRLVTDQHVEG